ncbi:MAG: thiamine diphosphokinase [Alkalispirochaeta sp.]
MNDYKGLVITGGNAPAGGITFAARSHWVVVAADSGLEYAASHGITPDGIVGDMDSISDRDLVNSFPEAKIEEYARAKDWTDTEIAMDFLWKRSINDISIVGGGGGRLDHLMAILALFERSRYPRQWFTDQEEITVIDDTVEFPGESGETVSLFPTGPDAVTMRSSGLRWPLDQFTWRHGDVGVSNKCTGGPCRVTVQSGRLLMVRALPWEVRLT